MHLRAIVFLSLLSFALCRSIQISCKQIRRFVDGHNDRRLRLAKGEVDGQPAAKEMKFIVWDDELAAKASKWASKNTYQHNPDNTIGSGRFETGENLYLFSTTNSQQKLNIDSALDAWFDEHKDYVYGPLKWSDFSRNDDVQIGHYTQMAWSNSVYLGCGITQFSNSPGWYSHMVVCNYGPAGNIIDNVPYSSGKGSHELVCGSDSCSQPYGFKCSV